jgi:hypothetical protein
MEELIERLKTGEIKPEFGNPNHIEAIKYLDRMSGEEAQLKSDRENGVLKTYEVTLHYSATVERTIEAYDKEDALERAEEEIDIRNLDLELEDYDIDMI